MTEQNGNQKHCQGLLSSSFEHSENRQCNKDGLISAQHYVPGVQPRENPRPRKPEPCGKPAPDGSNSKNDRSVSSEVLKGGLPENISGEGIREVVCPVCGCLNELVVGVPPLAVNRSDGHPEIVSRVGGKKCRGTDGCVIPDVP